MKIVKAGTLVFLLFAVLLVSAQKINSPYSRYGLGQLYGENLNTPLKAMGGISYGIWNPTLINTGNPASYAKFDSASFLFEVSIYANMTTHKTSFQKENSDYATLNYILVGFPVTAWWRSSLGVLPYSKIGYNVEVLVEGFDNVKNDLAGDGGLNSFYWGNGFNVTKNLRLGFDASLIYGNGSRSSMVYFPDSSFIFSSKTEQNTKGAGIIFDYGLQYDIQFKNNRLLTLGLVYSNNWYLHATHNYIAYTLQGGVDGNVEAIKDTILYEPEEDGFIILPDRFGFGFVYQQEGRWLVGGDFEWQNWNEFEAFGQNDSLNNAWRISFGGQYSPKHTSISSLLKRMSYRVGIKYINSYLSLFGNDINEYGISFGFGFPIKRSQTELDLSFEIGRRGTTKDGLIQENYVNIIFGVSIDEHWFHKRKYR
jgi:hypothetical protein